MTELQKLIEQARQSAMTGEDRETQRISFAFGNTHFENADITRDTVRRQSELLRQGTVPHEPTKSSE